MDWERHSSPGERHLGNRDKASEAILFSRSDPGLWRRLVREGSVGVCFDKDELHLWRNIPCHLERRLMSQSSFLDGLEASQNKDGASGLCCVPVATPARINQGEPTT